MNLEKQAIGFTQGMPFSDGYVAGDALYVAGQQGPDSNGKLAGRDITQQTTGAITAVKKVLEEGGFQMSDISKPASSRTFLTAMIALVVCCVISLPVSLPLESGPCCPAT